MRAFFHWGLPQRASFRLLLQEVLAQQHVHGLARPDVQRDVQALYVLRCVILVVQVGAPQIYVHPSARPACVRLDAQVSVYLRID